MFIVTKPNVISSLCFAEFFWLNNFFFKKLTVKNMAKLKDVASVTYRNVSMNICVDSSILSEVVSTT